MAGTTPINALRYLQSGDPAEIHTATQNLATDLDSKLVPRYTTTAARSAAITSPVAGMVCWAASAFWVYTGSEWAQVAATKPIVAEGARTSVATLSGQFLDVGSGTQSRNTGFGIYTGGFFQVTVAGWYVCTAQGDWENAGYTGRRIFGISCTTTGGSGLGRCDADIPAAQGVRSQSAYWEGFLPVGALIKPHIWQNSGGDLSMTNIRMTARLADPRITS